jgi:hypothetical protein
MRLNLRTLLGLSLALVLSTSAPALADNFLGVNWPTIGADTHPGIVFVIDAMGNVTATDGMQGPYDGVEDTYVGVINNSPNPVSSLTVSSTSSPALQLYGFDGDGIDTFGITGNATDNTGYGGPHGFYTNINAALTSGTVNFIGGVAGNGGSDFFSLEELPNAGNISGIVGGAAPEPTPILLAGMGILGLVGYKWGRRKQVA